MAPKSKEANYKRLNGKYLKNAEVLMHKGDYAQTAEKLWGACAEAIKAVAAKRGKDLGTHRSIGEFVTKLHKEHPDWNLIDSFNYASSLHVNFYEDHMPPEDVKRGESVVKEFVKRLKTLL
jgi:HEPN domain-containing protein